MFEIDDSFLGNAGYDVSSMDENKKNKLKIQYTDDLSQRVLMRLAEDLSDEEAGEFSDIQEVPGRALEWLNEFHADFRTRDDYLQVLNNLGNEADANVFYAGMLWMGYAVPKFGEVVQEEMLSLQKSLISKRQAAKTLLEELKLEDS